MKKHKFLSWIIALVMFSLSLPLHFFQWNAVAEGAPQSSAFNGIALTKVAAKEEEGGVMLEQYAMSTLDLSGASYLAIRYYNPTDAAWPVYLKYQEAQTIYPLTEGTPYTVYDDNFQLIENKQVQYNAVAPTACSSGYIVLPTTAFAGMAVVKALYITLPATTGVGISMHFGAVGYYTQANPDFAMDMVMLTDFAGWTEEWFAGRMTNADTVSLSLVKAPTTGLIGGVQLTQYNAAAGEGLMINRFTANNAVTYSMDISNVEYFAVEYANLTSEASATYVIMQDAANAQYTISAGAELIYLNHDFTYNRTVTAEGTYLRANTNEYGWILIPKTAFAGFDGTMVAMYLMMSAYTPALNGGAWQFGRVLTYGANAEYTQGTVIADLAKWDTASISARTTGASCVTISRVQAPEYTVTKSVDGVMVAKAFDQGSVYTPVAPTKAGSAFIGWVVSDGEKAVYETGSVTVNSHLFVEAAFVNFETQGVTIKTTETKGLRFTTGVSAESKQLLANLGLTATFGTRLTNETLGYLDIPVINWHNAEETVFTAVLKGFGTAHYNLVFTAQAYVEIAGVRYYAQATQSGSLAQVAYTMLNAEGASFTQAELDYLTPIASAYSA